MLEPLCQLFGKDAPSHMEPSHMEPTQIQSCVAIKNSLTWAGRSAFFQKESDAPTKIIADAAPGGFGAVFLKNKQKGWCQYAKQCIIGVHSYKLKKCVQVCNDRSYTVTSLQE